MVCVAAISNRQVFLPTWDALNLMGIKSETTYYRAPLFKPVGGDLCRTKLPRKCNAAPSRLTELHQGNFYFQRATFPSFYRKLIRVYNFRSFGFQPTYTDRSFRNWFGSSLKLRAFGHFLLCLGSSCDRNLLTGDTGQNCFCFFSRISLWFVSTIKLTLYFLAELILLLKFTFLQINP